MRKLIIGLILIVIGVLCLSLTSRISEGIFDNFFADVSSVNGGNNNSNNPTGGNNGSFSGVYDECYFQLCEPSEYLGNSVLHNVKPIKSGNFFYYSLAYYPQYYVKLSHTLDFTNAYYVIDGKTTLYEKTTASVDEVGEETIVIDLYNLDTYKDNLYFGNITDTLDETGDIMYVKDFNQFSLGDYTYLWDEQYSYNGMVLFIKELNNTISSATNGFSIPKYSHYYGFSINLPDKVIDNSVTGISII